MQVKPLESQQHTLRLTEQLYQEGVNARHDVVRAKAQVETTSAKIPSIEANLIAALRQLEVLVGQQPGTLAAELNATDKMPMIPSQIFLSTPIKTVRHRPDIQPRPKSPRHNHLRNARAQRRESRERHDG